MSIMNEVEKCEAMKTYNETVSRAKRTHIEVIGSAALTYGNTMERAKKVYEQAAAKAWNDLRKVIYLARNEYEKGLMYERED